jgi:hypothetical protein
MSANSTRSTSGIAMTEIKNHCTSDIRRPIAVARRIQFPHGLKLGA